MKYPEGSNLEYDQERTSLGSALRRLGHAVVGHEAEINQLREARISIDALSHVLRSRPGIKMRSILKNHMKLFVDPFANFLHQLSNLSPVLRFAH